MKRIIAVLLIVLAIPAFGQERMGGAEVQTANEIDLSYGVITLPDMANTLAAIFGTVFTLGLAQPDRLDCLGAVNLGYYHSLNEMFAVGAESSVELIRLTFKQGDQPNPNTNFDSYVSLMPSIKGHWLDYQHFGIYSKLSVGCTMQYHPAEDHQSSFYFYPSCQISPFGIELGGTHWRGFMELGFGVQGTLLAGLRWKF